MAVTSCGAQGLAVFRRGLAAGLGEKAASLELVELGLVTRKDFVDLGSDARRVIATERGFMVADEIRAAAKKAVGG